MKHLMPHSRPAKGSLDFVFFTWCEPNIADGFCYSLEFDEGVLGIRQTGGIAGVNEFNPLFKG